MDDQQNGGGGRVGGGGAEVGVQTETLVVARCKYCDLPVIELTSGCCASHAMVELARLRHLGLVGEGDGQTKGALSAVLPALPALPTVLPDRRTGPVDRRTGERTGVGDRRRVYTPGKKVYIPPPESVLEREAGDRVRDWPNSQDVGGEMVEWGDSSRDGVEETSGEAAYSWWVTKEKEG